ncbi:hypothetical protein [Paramaledivibacter caminithermalis]|jgi:hypothetical protein|uniref:Uncharacterized protein n=1 Tax=Paramaledivibacter caminithermalis (strain DSM 15212 / CIP 107654 / DViRD3) TaxID=1121301 RepID=A0A1M6LEE5_PARC5|nr:hypothetical protein [Paramaledivibacter caminithermalis]SHJ69580.1 hypothetical protein SAMN02745912_00756 [Paramaledivibacter caminithermalis DSM 15212]
MEKKYVIVGDNNSISTPMNRKEATDKVKEYEKQGISAYIVSENEGKRIKESGKFNTPKWE